MKGRKAVPVDRDIIDEVMEKMKVKVRLASAGTDAGHCVFKPG